MPRRTARPFHEDLVEGLSGRRPDGPLSLCGGWGEDSKQDDLRAHETGQQVLSRVEEEDLQVLATAHTGVTWFLGTLEGSISGQPLVARMRYTRTWARDQAGWKIIAANATFVTDGLLDTNDGTQGRRIPLAEPVRWRRTRS